MYSEGHQLLRLSATEVRSQSSLHPCSCRMHHDRFWVAESADLNTIQWFSVHDHGRWCIQAFSRVTCQAHRVLRLPRSYCVET